MRPFLLAWVLIGAPLTAQQAAPPRRLSADTAAIRRSLSEVFDTTASEERDSLFARQLPIIQTAVLDLLNSAHHPREANLWLSSLPGFRGPHAGQETEIGGIHFFSAVARELPSYALLYLSDAPPPRLLLLVNFPDINGPSLVAVFTRRGARWQVGLSHACDSQLEVFPLTTSSPAPVLILFDRYVRADGSQGALSAWRLGAPTASEIPLNLPQLQDAQFRLEDSSLSVLALQFLSHTRDCIMCTRRVLEFTLHRSGPGLRVSSRELTPWVTVVDSFYGLLETQKLTLAKTLLADPSLFPDLFGNGASVQTDTGSVVDGRGEVELHLRLDSTDSRYLRVGVRQQPQGWRITSIIKGHWDGEDIQWDAARPQ